MKVSELISKLNQFPQDMEVLISDGFKYNFYAGDYEVVEFINEDDQTFVDIGIGGLSQ